MVCIRAQDTSRCRAQLGSSQASLLAYKDPVPALEELGTRVPGWVSITWEQPGARTGGQLAQLCCVPGPSGHESVRGLRTLKGGVTGESFVLR